MHAHCPRYGRSSNCHIGVHLRARSKGLRSSAAEDDKCGTGLLRSSSACSEWTPWIILHDGDRVLGGEARHKADYLVLTTHNHQQDLVEAAKGRFSDLTEVWTDRVFVAGTSLPGFDSEYEQYS